MKRIVVIGKEKGKVSMYRNNTKIISGVEDLSNYIEGIDIYNSLLIDKLRNPELSREYYEITNYEYRPDLIAKDYYGSASYMGLLLLQGARGLDGYRRGEVLKLIPKNVLDNLISNL